MWAAANDPDPAGILGLDADRVILAAFAIGSGLAGVAGILVALDPSMSTTMGPNALMVAIVAAFIGGVSSSIPGVIIRALLLATAQQLAIWTLGSQLKDPVTFAVLLLFLLLWPQGILVRQVRKKTIENGAHAPRRGPRRHLRRPVGFF
jgi:branched-chain amino acid transport system permease protein